MSFFLCTEHLAEDIKTLHGCWTNETIFKALKKLLSNDELHALVKENELDGFATHFDIRLYAYPCYRSNTPICINKDLLTVHISSMEEFDKSSIEELKFYINNSRTDIDHTVIKIRNEIFSFLAHLEEDYLQFVAPN